MHETDHLGGEAMAQLAIKLNGVVYVVDTQATRDLFVARDYQGDQLPISAEFAAELFGAAKAWNYLEHVLVPENVSAQTSRWGQVDEYAERVLVLHTVADVLGKTEGLLLRQLIGVPSDPITAAHALAGTLLGIAPDQLLLLFADAGIHNMASVLTDVSGTFLQGAPAWRSGVAIDFDQLASLADQTEIAFSAGVTLVSVLQHELLSGSTQTDVIGWMSAVIEGFTGDLGSDAAKNFFSPRLIALLHDLSKTNDLASFGNLLVDFSTELDLVLKGTSSGFPLLSDAAVAENSAWFAASTAVVVQPSVPAPPTITPRAQSNGFTNGDDTVTGNDGDDALTTKGRGLDNVNLGSGQNSLLVDYSWTDDPVSAGPYYNSYSFQTGSGLIDRTLVSGLTTIGLFSGLGNDSLTGTLGPDAIHGGAETTV